MKDFNEKQNYDDVFLRDVTVGLLTVFHQRLQWLNTSQNGERLMKVPFQYSYVGSERYLMDLFVDDQTGTRVETNVDKYPRGYILLTSSTIKSSEITNPHTKILKYENDENGMMRKVYRNYRFYPIKLSYEITILLRTEIDMLKCQQAVMDTLALYQTFHIDYDHLNTPCIFSVPDVLNTEISREIQGLAKEEAKRTIKFSVDVHTNYPVKPVEQKGISENNRVKKVYGITSTLGRKSRQRTLMGLDSLKHPPKQPKF